MTPSRRQFRLPAADEAFLDSLGLPWEAVTEAGVNWVIICGYTLPPGFRQRIVDMAIRIIAGYPDAALDMAYFTPWIALESGRKISQTDCRQPLDGREWQQWSRHRTGVNHWVPGDDNLQTHYYYVQSWLEAEPGRS